MYALPAHWNPWAGLWIVRSQPHFISWPVEQNCVTAWAIPALEMAWTKAASRVPDNQYQLNLAELEILFILNVCIYIWSSFEIQAYSLIICAKPLDLMKLKGFYRINNKKNIRFSNQYMKEK